MCMKKKLKGDNMELEVKEIGIEDCNGRGIKVGDVVKFVMFQYGTNQEREHTGVIIKDLYNNRYTIQLPDGRWLNTIPEYDLATGNGIKKIEVIG